MEIAQVLRLFDLLKGEKHVNRSTLSKYELWYWFFPQDSTLAAMLLRPGPLPAILSAQFSETSDIDKVPRVYIKTMHDNVVKPAQQEAMIKRWPPSDVYVLESDHSPFFSTPFLLFGLLVKAAASVGCH